MFLFTFYNLVENNFSFSHTLCHKQKWKINKSSNPEEEEKNSEADPLIVLDSSRPQYGLIRNGFAYSGVFGRCESNEIGLNVRRLLQVGENWQFDFLDFTF